MSDLILRGVELAIFGMGTVFVFLTLLVLATMAMSALVARYAPEPVPDAAPSARSRQMPDTAVMAAIAAAVRAHRERRAGRSP